MLVPYILEECVIFLHPSPYMLMSLNTSVNNNVDYTEKKKCDTLD